MKTTWAGVVGLLAVAALSGCVGISIGNRESKSAPSQGMVIVASEPGDQATLAEIDAAAGLTMDQARREALEAIARRPALSTASQVHLANVAYKRLDFDQSKLAVLQALIQNRSFCPSAKQTIVAQLSKFSQDRDRQAILAAVNQRELNK
jgi:hypothetical protein